MGFPSRQMQTPEPVFLCQIYFEHQGTVHGVCGISLSVIGCLEALFKFKFDTCYLRPATIYFNQFIYLLMALVDGQYIEDILRFLNSEMIFLELSMYF